MQAAAQQIEPLQWTEGLSLDMPLMDETHQEFVDLLAKVVTAADASVLETWSELIGHTDAHFAAEDRWMQHTGFAPANCHSTQHKVILQVMREGERRGQDGDLAVVRQMAKELGLWFPNHAQSMDAALALHLRSAGYDPITGQVSVPQALPKQAIHGCGGASCSDAATPSQASPAEASPA
jgi:hemerythrin-like metal-binding protein